MGRTLVLQAISKSVIISGFGEESKAGSIKEIAGRNRGGRTAYEVSISKMEVSKVNNAVNKQEESG